MVYSPSFIEGPRPKSVSSSNFDTMFDNSIDLHFTSFTVDINFEMGFFEEGGRLFPKEMTLDFEFVYDSGDLIKTYVASGIGSDYKMQKSMEIKRSRASCFPIKGKQSN